MLAAIFYSFFLGNVWEIWLSDLFIAHWINIEEKINSLKNKEELLQRARSGKSLMTWHLIGQPINSSKLEMKVPVFEDKRHIWVIDEKSKTDILWICIMLYSNHTDTTSTETKDGCHHMILFFFTSSCILPSNEDQEPAIYVLILSTFMSGAYM